MPYAYEPATRECLNGCNFQILTTNNKSGRESITKKKLALEVAKLVGRYIEAIKVSVSLTAIDSFVTPSRLG